MSDLIQKPVLGSLLDYGNPHTIGLIAWWLMNEKCGSVVYDMTQHGYNGVLTNGASWNSSGNFGYSITFDGDNDYIELGTIKTSNKLQLSSGGTVSLWFNQPDFTGDTYQRLVDKSDSGGGQNGWSVYLGGSVAAQNDTRRFSINVDGNYYDTDNEVYDFGVWNHVAFVFSSAGYHIYLNGEECACAFQAGSATNPPSVQTNARIATWNHSDAREFEGRLDNIKVWGRTLNPDEVLKDYQDPFCPAHSGYRRRMVSEEIAAGGIVQAAGQADSTTTSTAGAIRLNRPGAGTAASTTESTSGAIRLNRPGAGAAASVTSSLSGAIRLNRPGAGQADSVTTTNAGATIGVLTEEELFRYRRFRLTSTYSRRLFKGVF